MKFLVAKHGDVTSGHVEFFFQGQAPGGADSVSKEEFEGKAGEVTVLRHSKKATILAGLGKKEEFEPEKLRFASGMAASAARRTSARAFLIKLPSCPFLTDAETSRIFCEGAGISLYDFSKFKTEKEDPATEKALSFFLEATNENEITAGIRTGTIMAESANFARDIANEPPNIADPEFVAKKAADFAKKNGIKCKVLQASELAKTGLHGIETVSSGSKSPGRLVVLEYGKGDTYCFVGKGITFDSGGISIKPAKDMDRMRWDKCGACAVFGIMKAAKELGIKAHVVGIMALAENMPAGFSYRPGDIFKTGGKSIEVLNTDAEGRIVLSDALSYVRDHYKPKAVIDMATLTGACVVALGSVAAGLMSNQDRLAKALESAGYKTGEKVWRLPLFAEYEQMIKSKFADIKNVGEPSEAGAITAAYFLKQFIGEWPWAHLDIAGTAYFTGPFPKPYYSWGATGAGVRICAQYLLDNAGK